jgi:transcriptional regulator with XRE-family HTH domain
VNHRGVAGFRPGVLRRHREQAGLAIAELAKLTGMSTQEIRLYEEGREPGPDRLAILARTFKVSVLDFIDQDILGYGLRGLRAAAGLRQADLVAASKLPQSWITGLESGRLARMNDETAETIASVLGVTTAAVRKAHSWDVARYLQTHDPEQPKPKPQPRPAKPPRPPAPRPKIPWWAQRTPPRPKRKRVGPPPSTLASRMKLDGVSAFKAARLRELREQAGLTIPELARLTRMSVVNLDGYETGKVPRPARIILLAKTLNVELWELVDRDILGYGLQSLRVAAGLMQLEAGLRADIALAHLVQLEGGHVKHLADDLAERLASAYGTTIQAISEAHDWDVAHRRPDGSEPPPSESNPSESNPTELTPSIRARRASPMLIRRGQNGPPYTNPVYACTKVAPAASRSHASSGVSMPPAAISTSWSPARSRSRRSTASDRSRNGGPDSPPAPIAATSAAGAQSPDRDAVVFVAMIPSSRSATARSAIASTSSSARSGAILTSNGTPSSTSRTAASSGLSRSAACRSRNPGVFGELTLTTT